MGDGLYSQRAASGGHADVYTSHVTCRGQSDQSSSSARQPITIPHQWAEAKQLEKVEATGENHRVPSSAPEQ